ncbi:hypothetical protein [Lysinibacillus odysseyi]|uniref:Lipoprotein n=1 Tax=Lysinibacillus odysseyi 34hs-1 = NBRC 100172 TaxID=1220589 RepID=A0A0A3IF84_9BACI|nr:hypothetical protein [Lysinibacillus odysseyi]KGR83359.1 hypothetical protein CD32_16115 [Lysinibacillus odysseyi 34hs-1 = NBRC 100172]
MKKTIFLVCLLLLVMSLAGCSRIINMIEVDKEKIGAEYTGVDGYVTGEDNNGTCGEARNYESSLNENVWTTEFDYMNGTGVQEFTIETADILRINGKFDKGEVWIKITQGDLSLSEIQKVQAINNKEMTIDLSQWQNGEIVVWLVVEKGEDGLIQIEHLEN